MRRQHYPSKRLRIIADKFAEKAEQGDLAAQQIADRLDGKPMQVVECGDIALEAMTDQQLMAVIRGGLPEPLLLTLVGSSSSNEPPARHQTPQQMPALCPHGVTD
jgi:hypothetical protein